MKSDMFIDPKSDYAFKRFFGTVSNKELTIGFLNSLLNKDIKDIIFHNVEMQGNNTDSRKAVFDLFCEGSDGELFIVEIQKKRQKAKIERKKRKRVRSVLGGMMKMMLMRWEQLPFFVIKSCSKIFQNSFTQFTRFLHVLWISYNHKQKDI